jgi:hypothetical protein
MHQARHLVCGGIGFAFPSIPLQEASNYWYARIIAKRCARISATV